MAPTYRIIPRAVARPSTLPVAPRVRVVDCPACGGAGELVYYGGAQAPAIEPSERVDRCEACMGAGSFRVPRFLVAPDRAYRDVWHVSGAQSALAALRAYLPADDGWTVTDDAIEAPTRLANDRAASVVREVVAFLGGVLKNDRGTGF